MNKTLGYYNGNIHLFKLHLSYQINLDLYTQATVETQLYKPIELITNKVILIKDQINEANRY
jgi:hypothetical protein